MQPATRGFGPEWEEAISLLHDPGGWKRPRFDQFWVGTMVRRFAEQHPQHLAEWLTPGEWMRILLRRVRPDDPPQPKWIEDEVRRFLTAGGNRIASDSPWCVMIREVPRKQTYRVAEYSITRVLPLEKDLQSDVAHA